MDFDRPFEEVLCQVSNLDRQQCINELTHFGKLRLDFTVEYLEDLGDEQLRHMLVAAVLTVRKRSA